ncbi:MAG: NUDIX domain-containing protein [Candidatus Hydrogenedens sp.]|nr:NUDIX domain-containing protein [Candidatus Hydrogenedentota bacterium]NLF58231.1 NUDIX domain-containing protein [Candidatus Hydrogenedens sp.]
MRIDRTWYVKPAGIYERLTAGGVVVRRATEGLLVALVREADLDGHVLPKGGVEPGESLDAAALREIEEESGLSQLEKLAELRVLERLESERKFWSIIHYGLYRTGQIQGEIRDPEHHPGMGWFPLFELPDMFWPDERELLESERGRIVEIFSGPGKEATAV